LIFTKPLRPIFITPVSDLNIVPSSEYNPVILLTASSSVLSDHRPVGRFRYVQGAADDEESWSHGLTSTQFWESREELLACTTEEKLISRIEDITRMVVPREVRPESAIIKPSGISLGIGITPETYPTIICGSETSPCRHGERVLYTNIPAKSRVAHVMVHEILPAVVSFALSHDILRTGLISIKAANPCREKLDLSIAVALVVLCLFFDDKGVSNSPVLSTDFSGAVTDRRTLPMNKNIIRRRLMWITAARGHQAERFSRQFLKIVNTFLMSDKHHHSIPN